MTDIQNPATTRGNSLFAGLVKGAAIAATLTWALLLLAFISALSGPGWNALGLLIALVFATPVFFIFVLPALLFSFLGGEPGVKVGAGFLVAGVLTIGAMFAGPMLRTMF